MNSTLLLSTSLGLLLAITSPLSAAAPPERIQGRLEATTTHRFRLTGNTHPSIAAATDLGEVDPSRPMPRIILHFTHTPKQQAELNALLAAQLQRSNPQFHKWLTPEQFGDRFGLNPNDLAKLNAWLSEMGFSDIEVAPSRTSISASATAAQVGYAFNTRIHRYRQNGIENIANSADPSLPLPLKGLVSHIRGLNDFRPRPTATPKFTNGPTGHHFLTPADFATIYDVLPLYQSGIDGSGQTIAIAGQTDIQLSDIEAFQAVSGRPQKDPQIILYGPDPGTLPGGNLSEADLDLEWAGAVAPGATLLYVNSNNAFLSAFYAIENNLANVISIS